MFTLAIASSFRQTLLFIWKRAFKVSLFLFVSFLILGTLSANAAITEDGTVQDAFFENTTNVGGGAILPLVKFRLKQTSGSDTLSNVGVKIIASSTMAS